MSSSKSWWLCWHWHWLTNSHANWLGLNLCLTWSWGTTLSALILLMILSLGTTSAFLLVLITGGMGSLLLTSFFQPRSWFQSTWASLRNWTAETLYSSLHCSCRICGHQRAESSPNLQSNRLHRLESSSSWSTCSGSLLLECHSGAPVSSSLHKTG